MQHENVVHAIQRLRCVDSVDALERTALSAYPYREYDDYGMLASQCAWALADIGTPKAHEALVRLGNCDRPVIAKYALERLKNWQREMPRKASKFTPGAPS